MERETADPNRGAELEEVGLGDENLASVDAELADLGLRKLHLFPSFAFQQPAYYVIQHPPIHISFNCHHFWFLFLEFDSISLRQAQERKGLSSKIQIDGV